MALSHTTKIFAVNQCRISKVTADITSGITYSASIALPGVQALKVTGQVTTQDLRGDNTYLDSDTVLDSVLCELDHAKLNLDAINVMLGGTVTDVTGPPVTATWNLPNPPVFSYFKVEARTLGVDTIGGDMHVTLTKCKLADFPQLGFQEENYQRFQLKLRAVPPIATGTNWMTVLLSDTATAVA